MNEPFFSRWSQRKQAVARGLQVEDPAPAKPAQATEPSSVTTTTPERPGSAGGIAKAARTEGGGHAPSAPAHGDDKGKAPLPTLDEARALTPRSDFQPFMQPGVAQDVRNAAVKQLFTDPHFNVMDGLDIYIGDYNAPDPMPVGMLQKMVGAQLLGLLDKGVDAAAQTADLTEPLLSSRSPSAGPGGNPGQKPVEQEDSPVVAQSPTSPPDLAGSASPAQPPLVNTHPEHDDPDLQLQPNHAPASPSSGPSTG